MNEICKDCITDTNVTCTNDICETCVKKINCDECDRQLCSVELDCSDEFAHKPRKIEGHYHYVDKIYCVECFEKQNPRRNNSL